MTVKPGQIVETIIVKLIESAFYFLESSIKSFDEDQKISCVHFAIAIELFIKAILAKEHWALIFQEVDHASIEKLKSGDFKSVRLEPALGRLESLSNAPLGSEARKVFLSISKHRNRMIHFTDHFESTEHEQAKLEEIALEQLDGWFHIQRLLNIWFEEETEFQQKLWQIAWSMKSQRAYLEVRYEKLKPEIEKKIKAGIVFEDCRQCGHLSGERDEIIEKINMRNCLVCDNQETLVALDCIECDEPINLNSYDVTYTKCENCGHQSEETEFAKQFGETDYDPVDHIEINCAECMGYHTVIKNEDIYLCGQCFSVSDEMDVCGWCHEGQVNGGDLEISYITGCEFCDGSSGWRADD